MISMDILVKDYDSFCRLVEWECSKYDDGGVVPERAYVKQGIKDGMCMAYELLTAWHNGTETPPVGVRLDLRMFTESVTGKRVPVYYYGALYDSRDNTFFSDDGSAFIRDADVEWRVFIE